MSPETTPPRTGLVPWILTPIFILAGAFLLDLVSLPLADALDIVTPGRAVEIPSPPPPSPPPPPAPPAEPEGPQMSHADVHLKLRVVIDQALALIELGASELPNYEGMDSAGDPTLAKRMRERFGRWGPIWRNRLGKVLQDLPPAEECSPHSDLLVACGTLRAILGELSAMPDADSLADAVLVIETLRPRLQTLQVELAPPEPTPGTGAPDSAVESGEFGAVAADDDSDQVRGDEQGVDLESDG